MQYTQLQVLFIVSSSLLILKMNIFSTFPQNLLCATSEITSASN